MKKRRKPNGFTMVELLATIVILGILAVIGVSSISRLIKGAHENQRAHQEKTVSMAAESYLQANTTILPKTIGEVTKVKLTDLKKANYIEKDIMNSNGETCMKNSYVRVYKYSKTKYTYTPYIYCGKEQAPETETIPKPGIKIQYFYVDSSGSKEEHIDDEIVESNVGKAQVRIILVGGKNTDGTELLLDGYTYSILVRQKTDSTIQEVYNSGTMPAGHKTTIMIEKSLKDYIDLTDVTSFTVKVYARNTAGGSFDTEKVLGDKSVNYNDKIPPTCSDISGEAESEDKWITNDKSSRIITVKCNDGDGSGCLRETFSKTWPNKEESEAEYSWVMIKDNAGNKNIKNCNHGEGGCCKVRVNVDYTSPTVEIEAYGRSSHGTMTGSNILQKNSPNTKGWESSKTRFVATTKDTAYIISASDYTNTINNWFNKAKYPQGIIYKVDVKDSLHLDHWEWSVNASNTKEDSTLGRGKESSRGYFTASNKETIYIYFEDDGYRHGMLKVYDRAGNVTKIDIYANLDKVAPNVPNLRNTNQFKMNRVQKNGSGNLGIYSFDSWSTNYLKGEFTVKSIADNINSNYLELSGPSHYNYIFTNQDGRATTGNTKTSTTLINAEGTGKFKANACDMAGNCSDYSNIEIVKIDTTPPRCVVSGGNTRWTNQTVTVSAHCEEENIRYGSGCKTADFKYDYIDQINTKEAGAAGNKNGGVISDIAGNETICAANKTVQIDKTNPTCSVAGGSNSWSNSITITATCSDTGGSGCATTPFSYTYNTNQSITNAGAKGASSGGIVFDNAGNQASCRADQIVKIDATPPTCTVSGGNSSWTKGSRRITATCSDTGGSGCTVTSFSKNYTKEINTNKAGAEDVNKGGTVSDKAGNITKCAANQTVKIDLTKPSIAIEKIIGYKYKPKATRYFEITISDSGSGLGERVVDSKDSCENHTFKNNFGCVSSGKDYIESGCSDFSIDFRICDCVGNCEIAYKRTP